MKIALNALKLSETQTYRAAGINRYITELLAQLRVGGFEHDFEAVVAVAPEGERLSSTRNFRCHSVGRGLVNPTARIVWEQCVLPLLLTRRRPDLLHALAFVSPILWPCGSVVTVFDLSFLHFPEAFNRANRQYLSLFTGFSARRAREVITISESTRRDVIRYLGVPPDRVSTIYCGVDPDFRPLAKSTVEGFRQQRGLPKHFILYLGTLEPRKNVPALVSAYADLRKRIPEVPKLVIAGSRGWKDQQIFATVERLGLQSEVLFPGFVPDEEQVLWYNAASIFAYPSRFEGFGLPVLEAMACGTPVVTSSSSSLPEVVGDGGLMVDPDDVGALADALARVISDASLHGALSLAGQNRASRFSWRRMAAETVRVYERCA